MNMMNSPLNVSELDGQKGFIINGINSGDESGFSVSYVGDINDDGIDDLIIGAPRADGDDNETGNAGESYVVFGGSDIGGEDGNFNLANLMDRRPLLEKSSTVQSESEESLKVEPSNLSTILPKGVILYGSNSNNRSGYSVSGKGDINNDGIDDLIISAPGIVNNRDIAARVIDTSNSGKTYIVFGNKNIGTQGNINLSSIDGTNGFIVEGIDTGGEIGNIDVSYAGDINDDGIDDFIIGAPSTDFEGGEAGASYVVFGGSNIGGEDGNINLSELNGTNGISIIFDKSGSHGAGWSVSSAGDVNDDGIDDLIIGVPFSELQTEEKGNAGKAYVVYGGSNIGGETGKVSLSSINGSNGFVVRGNDSSDRLGYSVSSIGDINDDGIDDIIIGIPGGDEGNEQSDVGESYVVFGGSGIGGENGIVNITNLDGSKGFILKGANKFNQSGWSVSGLGDVNDDGIDDLIIGEYAGNNSTDAYVVYGSKGIGATGSLLLSQLNGKNGFIVNGIDNDGESGMDVSGLGDVNNDGVNDFIIGSQSADVDLNEGDYEGKSYVVYGSLATKFAITDMNGDNKADVLKRNPNDGKNDLLKMDGANVSNVNSLLSVDDRAWRIKDTADFNGDGKGDILWRDEENGENAIWTTDGENVTDYDLIPTVEDLDWEIQAADDFNGDNKADILWQDRETGETAIWTMDGAMVKSYDMITTVEDLNWEIQAAADFNGDNKADILWRHQETGKNALWTMDGAMVNSYDMITTFEDLNWEVKGAADFDADNKADIFWMNKSTGQYALWSMNGAMVDSFDLSYPTNTSMEAKTFLS
ncbi:MAG: FG-GAP-like repeat-containing protein [Cyanobacteria bacterium P01_A01_bin.84]